ncbi:hypothetical protein POM88_028583 [Heracleum sosnowskyi]|uniref:ATP-dependent DNA helicase n=1 Tax=Heracleum sosnowskyi TaxID=360622 RepID=A0AAD8ME61_9APIA|nr:hypothetical protein POM88_028583 [Heracleum sosnowskyi]
MMKEYVRPPNKLNSVNELLEEYDKEQKDMKENVDTHINKTTLEFLFSDKTTQPCCSVHVGETKILPQYTETLLSNVFNYELGMMKLNECEELNIPLHPLTPAEPVPPSDKLGKRGLGKKRTPLSPFSHIRHFSSKVQCSNQVPMYQSTPLPLLSSNYICEDQKMKTKFIPRKLVEKDTPALQKENCNLNIEVPPQFQKSTLPTNKCETTSHKRKASISDFGTKITCSRKSLLHPVLNVDKTEHVKRNKTFASPCTPSVDESTTYRVTKTNVKTKTNLCTPRQQLPPLKSLEQQTPRNKGKEPMYQSSQERRFNMSSRSLNYDDDPSECNTRAYNNDIEYSLIRDFGSDESDFSSGEDEGDNRNYDFSEMDTDTGTVVSEYATLGAPNVQCMRSNEGITPRLGGRLYQQYVVDAFSTIEQARIFGSCLGVMYVVEFQKRGLPHVHMLIWLDSASKLNLQGNVDKFVSAEIPDPEKDPLGYAAVKAHMMHGPCGYEFPNSPCMKQHKCIRHFPKKYCPSTRRLTGNPLLILNEMQQQFYALAEIHNLLKGIGRSLKDYQTMPQPPHNYLDCSVNNLIIEETSYDITAMEKEYEGLFSQCNKEQVVVYNSVMDSVDNKKGGVFFVYGSGGCGKTYLWRTLISKLRSERKIVLPVASSGIAATLMPGGRTAHSRFKIPILLDDYSMCSISHTSDIAELIKRTSLIIWDEAPMQHRYAFECLDRSLRDIMKAVDPQRYHMPFGGITVVLAGDFRQILPVIPGAGRSQIVGACITKSKIWKIATVFKLLHNMRLNKGKDAEEVQNLTRFAKWVLDVGDGKIRPPKKKDAPDYIEEEISIPLEFCNLHSVNSVAKMIESTFTHFMENFNNPDYLSERAILTPTNQTVGHVNSAIVDMIPGEMFSYFSIDTAEDFPGSERDQLASFPPEYLNSINIPGLPLHELKLKVGVVVMLMRNLNQTLGLCNGTRMMVTKCLNHCVECEVISGQFKGTKHFIPRMELSPTETKLPFKLCRKQMPLQICYAMTINKAQGQSLEKVALYLPKSCFTHGQLYVAVSRVTSPKGLKMFINDKEGNTTNITENVVYKEIFSNLPVT